MADACADCPDYIRSAVREPVAVVLGQVRSVKAIANLFNNALAGISDIPLQAVCDIVDAIPVPPVLDLTEILDVLLCPLTPVAVAVDPTLLATLDPTEQFRLIQDTFRRFLIRLVADYENALLSLISNTVNIAKRLFEDLKRINLDAILLVKAIAITEFVETTCPEEFVDGPYDELDEELENFDLTGFVPTTDLDPDVEALVLKLGEGETKLEAWRFAATTTFI